MEKLRRYIKNMKIRTKMLWTYVVIVTMAVAAICLMMFFYLSRNYRSQLLYSANQSFSQAEEFLEYRVGSVRYVSNLLRVNSEIIDILSKPEAIIKHDIITQNSDMLQLEDNLYTITNSIEIHQISLYVPDYLMYANQEVLFRNLNVFQESEEYERLDAAGDDGCWLPPENLYSAETTKNVNVLSYLRKIRDTTNLSRMIGVQRVSIKSSDISSIMEKSNITTEGLVWIENSRGELIACSNQERYEQMEQQRKLLIQTAGAEGGWVEQKAAGDKYMVHRKEIAETDWTLIAALPNRELSQAGKSVFQPLLMIVSMMVLLATLLSLYFSNVITSRISKLAHQMERIQVGAPHEKRSEEPNDEIGQLFQSFDYMSDRLELLVAREYENGKNVKQAELRALQAQINPHFLYNTLDLINWEALDCGASKITEISQALARFYKLSLNHGKEFSSVKEELAHVGFYIQIQNYRYDNRLKLIREVPERLLEYQILHIVLQPLVENSFVHGMLGKSEAEVLQLRITGYEENDDFCLEVEDNGCGMTNEQMASILTDDSDSSHGYGVRNIHTRIQLVYGEGYGLKYMSNQLGGVTVRLRFPKRETDKA